MASQGACDVLITISDEGDRRHPRDQPDGAEADADVLAGPAAGYAFDNPDGARTALGAALDAARSGDQANSQFIPQPIRPLTFQRRGMF